MLHSTVFSHDFFIYSYSFISDRIMTNTGSPTVGFAVIFQSNVPIFTPTSLITPASQCWNYVYLHPGTLLRDQYLIVSIDTILYHGDCFLPRYHILVYRRTKARADNVSAVRSFAYAVYSSMKASQNRLRYAAISARSADAVISKMSLPIPLVRPIMSAQRISFSAHRL